MRKPEREGAVNQKMAVEVLRLRKRAAVRDAEVDEKEVVMPESESQWPSGSPSGGRQSFDIGAS